MTIKPTPVTSSNIHTIGYDPETKKLHVAFKGSGTYVYDGVSPEHHAALMASDSKGKYLAKHVIGRYPHIKDKGE